MRKKDPYRENRQIAVKRERVVVELPPEEVAAIDEWAVPNGFPSRKAAIAFLVRKGIAAGPVKSVEG